MEFKDYYGILDISRQATQDEIKRAYRRLARKYHPDVSKEINSEQRFKEVQEAYEVLKDPEKRAAYDNVGSGWSAGQEFRPPPNWDTGFEFSGGFSEQKPFSDFFETLFGGNNASSGRRRRSQFSTQKNANKATDHHAKVKIDLEDAYIGATRSIVLATPDIDIQGRVATKERILKVKIPAGITAGKRIRLSGQGAPKANGTRGDLYLEVLFNPHRIFRAEGLDIHIDLPVTPWEVALGRTINVPTLGGEVDLHIPAASQNGNKLRLKGRGLPGSPAGDQIVTLRVWVPEAKTAKAREFYEQMEKEFRINPRQSLEL